MKRPRHHSFGAVVGAVCAGLLVAGFATPAGAQSAPPSTQAPPSTEAPPTTKPTTPTTKPAAPKTQTGGPGAPTITNVTAGNEDAQVTWKVSTKAGAPPATKYEITPYRGKAPQKPVTVDAPATSATVTHLANKAKYTFTVTAIDAQGVKSKASIPSKAVTPVAPGTTWYKSKRIWAGVLVVLAAIAAAGVFFFRRQKKTAADADADADTASTPSSVPPEGVEAV